MIALDERKLARKNNISYAYKGSRPRFKVSLLYIIYLGLVNIKYI